MEQRAIRSSIGILVFFLGIGAIAVAQDRVTVSSLTVVVRLSFDSSVPSRRITARVKDEAEAIWRPYGIQFDWTTADPTLAAGSVALDARIERRFDRERRLASPKVLGLVELDPATPSRQPIYVSFDATESVLAQRTLRTVAGIVLDRDLARALGRVLAHEIGHVLIGGEHDRAGLMRAAFSAEDLADPDSKSFRLTCSSTDRLRRRLAMNEYTQPGGQQGSGPLDFDDIRDTPREFGDEASCITTQPAR